MGRPEIPDSRDVIVVGGGVVGSAIAWRAAREGASVALVDPDPLPAAAASASWAAAGMLTPVTEAHYGEEDLLTLNLESARRYPDFVTQVQADSDLDVGFRECGTLVVARDGDDLTAISDLAVYLDRLGVDFARVRSEEARRIEPHLAPRIRGGLSVEGDHQVDNRALLLALQAGVKRSGGDMVGGRVVRIKEKDRRVKGVKLADGTVLNAPTVVIAAGVWSSFEDLPPHVLPELRPVKGQLLHLRGAPLLERIVRGLEVYIVPRTDGRVVVGATMEERGFDLTRTAEAAYELLRDAYELVPGILELELVEHAVGLRPTTADNAPAIGRTQIEGLLVAIGHFRNGVLLAPVTADAIVSLMQGRDPGVDLKAFDPGRFERSRVVS